MNRWHSNPLAWSHHFMEHLCLKATADLALRTSGYQWHDFTVADHWLPSNLGLSLYHCLPLYLGTTTTQLGPTSTHLGLDWTTTNIGPTITQLGMPFSLVRRPLTRYQTLQFFYTFGAVDQLQEPWMVAQSAPGGSSYIWMCMWTNRSLVEVSWSSLGDYSLNGSERTSR